MFTGIIQATAPVLSATTRGGCRAVRIRKPARWRLALGQSVSVDGICSTVIRRAAGSFDVEYMPETLSKTTASAFSKGCIVNLERPLAFGAPLDGHLVQGHVDARGRVAVVAELGRAREIIIAVSKVLARHITLHGSVAINGVSLTVARLPAPRLRQADKRGISFTVALVPYTLAHTNLARLNTGDEVNVEADRAAMRSLATSRRGATVSRDAKKALRKRG